MKMCAPRILLVVCLALALLGTLLHLAAFVAPMWLWLSKDGYFFGIGLWYITGCYENCSIATPNLQTESNSNYHNWRFDILRSMETIGLIGAVFLCICLIILRVGWDSWQHMKTLKMVAITVGILTVTSMIVGDAIFAAYYHRIMIDSLTLSSFSFPWSFIMSLLALVFFIVVCLLLLFCKDDDPLSKMPVSADPKMALTPTVTNSHNGRKYYVPSPYSDDRRSGTEESYKDDRPLYNGVANKGYSSEDYRPRSYAEPSLNKQQFGPSYLAPYDDQGALKRPASYAERPNYSRNTRYGDEREPRNVGDREPRYVGDREPRYVGDQEPRYVDNREREPPRDREPPRYQDREEPVYSHYVERSRPPAGGRSVLPPISNIPSDMKYTHEIRDGNSSTYMYKPNAPPQY